METTQDVCPPASPFFAAKVVPPVTPAMLADILGDVERWGNQKEALHWILSPETLQLLRESQMLSECRTWKDGEPTIHETLFWNIPVHVNEDKKGPFGALISMHIAGT